MRCPHCEIKVEDESPTCSKCGFGIVDLDRDLGRPPEPQGRVSDFAGVLSTAAARRIDVRLAEFERRTKAQFRLVTRKSTAPRKPAEYVFWLFNRWNVGDFAGDENRGILVLLAVEERRIECEVGYGLEEVVSDETAGAVLDHEVVPLLEEGNIDEALSHAAEILSQLVEGGARRPLWERMTGWLRP